ncbi:hypothetical protein PPACK8108_LOCUS24494 [Phakopsora pachyrhizi]|uniref:Reverse transcriptase domain-containing protein n=1 Tax=Phakopsora pachyrhizi TaxID=170000 RepID=A0AAV0BRZ3_PHAPC|nr:hypothetical protein PPACK8108_LOCUS24494 [Phakopsora pachyrhizi]
MENTTEGMYVPNMPNLIKGLLFADDTNYLANSPEKIQNICSRLELYCQKWYFAIGHSKFNVEEYHPDTRPSSDRSYSLQNGIIHTFNTYKYLGCMIHNMVDPQDPYPIERDHAKSLASKVDKKMHISLPILANPSIHLLVKTRTIQTYIAAAGLYGSEWIGRNQKRTRLIQSAIDKCCRIAYGHSSTSLNLSSLLMMCELGITPVSIHSTKQHYCLWNKGEDNKTTLQELILHPYVDTSKGTWLSNTVTSFNKDNYAAQKHLESNNQSIIWISQMRDLKWTLHPKALKPIGDNNSISQVQKQFQQKMHEFHISLLYAEFERENPRL